MTAACPECGATLPASGSCLEHFHALLLLEAEIPGGPGDAAHFLAVSSYVLQHPEAMNYTAEALAGSRQNVAKQLAGHVTMEHLRRRVRQVADGPSRVTRRTGDPVPRWPVNAWPMTVLDVLAGGTRGYAVRVERWAGSIMQALHGLQPNLS